MEQPGNYSIAAVRPGACDMMGLRLHPVNTEEVHAFMDEVIGRREKALVLNLNVHCVNLASGIPWLKDFLNSGQLVFCDGDGVRLGLKILGLKVPPKITYNKWIWQLAEHCEKKGHRLFLVGAKPGIADQAARKLCERFPRLVIAGTHHGYFDRKGAENEAVVDKINRSEAHIVVTGFGMPVQEEWLRDNWKKIRAHVFLTGGAVFDYASGRLAKAPEWMIRGHLEWLFRFFQEPRRLFKRYMIGNPVFLARVISYRLNRKGI